MAVTRSGITIRVAQEFQALFDSIHFNPKMLYGPAVKIWRKLPDRENGVWDLDCPDGSRLRMHVKRYSAAVRGPDPADDEAAGFRFLEGVGIPTAKLIAWGKMPDKRSFVVVQDLEGFEAGDKLIQGGVEFKKILNPTADLAAKLHTSNLHHRDLYLCHFFVKLEGRKVDVRLIDVARLGRLPGLLRKRWIVKDLAQFWYSTTELKAITDAQRDEWLSRYMEQSGLKGFESMKRSVERKSRWIAAHDAKLRRKQPTRNISIPPM
jgi:hypothetical protein